MKYLSGISHTTCHNWMNWFYPTTCICPHKTDYCETCKNCKIKLNSLKLQMQMRAVRQWFMAMLICSNNNNNNNKNNKKNLLLALEAPFKTEN